MKNWPHMRRYHKSGLIRLQTCTKVIVLSLLLFLAVQQLVFIGLSRLQIRTPSAEEIKLATGAPGRVRYLSVNNTLYRQAIKSADGGVFPYLPGMSPPALRPPTNSILRRCLRSARKAMSLHKTLETSAAGRPEWKRKAEEMMQREIDSCLSILEGGGRGRGEANALLERILAEEEEIGQHQGEEAEAVSDAQETPQESSSSSGSESRGDGGGSTRQHMLQPDVLDEHDPVMERHQLNSSREDRPLKEIRSPASTIRRLRSKLDAAEAQVRQLTFEKTLYSQIASRAVPHALHCVVLRLTLSSSGNGSAAGGPPSSSRSPAALAARPSPWQALGAGGSGGGADPGRRFGPKPPQQLELPGGLPAAAAAAIADPRLVDPRLFHYALFSDNVLAVAVVVNSTAHAAWQPHLHVFHVITDRLHLVAIREWFRLHPPRGNMAWEVRSVEDYPWLTPESVPVLRQIGTEALRSYYFRVPRVRRNLSAAASSHEIVGDIKYRNPKYLFILNHLRFYLPRLFPAIPKVLFLDDDVVVQKDLSGLWKIPMHGNVNLAVETCGRVFHRFKTYLNFSSPLLQGYDPEGCGWAYGMNLFDLEVWRKHNFTERYHFWQLQNENRTLWRLGTLPPALLTFYNATQPLDKRWHVLGLGSKDNINLGRVEAAAVLHYNGHAKPWLDLAIPMYHKYWARHAPYGVDVFRTCNFMPPHHN